VAVTLIPYISFLAWNFTKVLKLKHSVYFMEWFVCIGGWVFTDLCKEQKGMKLPGIAETAQVCHGKNPSI
jgi:hypothetical protein